MRTSPPSFRTLWILASKCGITACRYTEKRVLSKNNCWAFCMPRMCALRAAIRFGSDRSLTPRSVNVSLSIVFSTCPTCSSLFRALTTRACHSASGGVRSNVGIPPWVQSMALVCGLTEPAVTANSRSPFSQKNLINSDFWSKYGYVTSRS